MIFSVSHLLRLVTERAALTRSLEASRAQVKNLNDEIAANEKMMAEIDAVLSQIVGDNVLLFDERVPATLSEVIAEVTTAIASSPAPAV